MMRICLRKRREEEIMKGKRSETRIKEEEDGAITLGEE